MNDVAAAAERTIKEYIGALHFIRFLREENLFRNQMVGVVVRKIRRGDLTYDPGAIVVVEPNVHEPSKLISDGDTARTYQETVSVYTLAKGRISGTRNPFKRVDNVPFEYVRELDLEKFIKKFLKPS
jgi:hypothetical protein